MRLFFFTLLLSLSLLTIAQTPVKNLVFEGAGIRGIAYCGALQQLEEKGIMSGIERVGGTSAGAITALCVSLGYNSHELETIIGGTNFRKFNDGRFAFAGGINRVNHYFGWYRSKEFDQWLGALIKAKTGNDNISFKEMQATKKFKALYVTGTNLSKQKMMIFSHEHSPHMRIRDAVRISMSIPLYFEAVFLDSALQVHYQPKNKKGLDVLVDGGFIANFPIRLFDSTKYISDTTGKNSFAINLQTAGLRIDSDAQTEADRQGQTDLVSLPVTNLKEYMTAFMALMIEGLNRPQLNTDDWKRTISIPDGKLGPRIRKLKKEEIELLVKNGRLGVEKWIQ
jgi:NTE family protein